MPSFRTQDIPFPQTLEPYTVYQYFSTFWASSPGKRQVTVPGRLIEGFSVPEIYALCSQYIQILFYWLNSTILLIYKLKFVNLEFSKIFQVPAKRSPSPGVEKNCCVHCTVYHILDLISGPASYAVFERENKFGARNYHPLPGIEWVQKTLFLSQMVLSMLVSCKFSMQFFHSGFVQRQRCLRLGCWRKEVFRFSQRLWRFVKTTIIFIYPLPHSCTFKVHNSNDIHSVPVNRTLINWTSC